MSSAFATSLDALTRSVDGSLEIGLFASNAASFTRQRRRADINRLLKYLTASSMSSFWPALMRGVMPGVEHSEAIRRLAPRTLLDVGANKGQFSVLARHLFSGIEIHAFEPIQSARDAFEQVVVEPYFLHGVAVGATTEDRPFFVTSRADSSSLLRPGPGQAAAYRVTLQSTQVVQARPLDEVLLGYRLAAPILMKIDVQGAELEVLKGASKTLRATSYVYCEASFVELYRGQPLASDVVGYMRDAGFHLTGVFNQSVTKRFGPTQADFLFSSEEQNR